MAVQDWVTVIVNSLQNLWMGFVDVLGSVVGALVVLLVGLMVASGLAAFVRKVIEMIKLDSFLRSLGIEKFFERGGMRVNSGKFFGKIVYWFIVIVFILAASDILGFATLSEFLRDVLLYIPNVIVGVLIMLAAIVLANFLKDIVKSSVKSAKLTGYKFLGSLTWWAITVFGFLAAISQLGIARDIVNTLVAGFIAMIALAGGLAFGLGGRDYAKYLISRLRDHHEE
ncbi:MAG TPA: hypothetical protein VKO61_01025 [Candidatus Paceibacterota bacterium]|nr:hypothetical protein [Candidatus Paceibacterota bacterium]